MSTLSLLLHEVRVRRRTILGWAIGLAFFATMYMAFYPSLPDEMRNLDIASIDFYKSLGFRTMATFDGYLQSSVLNFLPLLVGAFGIVLGAGALAGEEDAGTLELLAALPISRLQLYVAKAAALLLTCLAVMLAVALVAAGVFQYVQSEVDTAVTTFQVFRVILVCGLVGPVFVSIGLLLGTYLPSRGAALAASSAVLVVTFFGNNLAGMVTQLEHVQPLFPFHYFTNIADEMTGDLPWRDVLVLLAMGITPLVLGALTFQRRDLTVGAWPWERPRIGAPAPALAGVERAPATTARRGLVAAAVALVALMGCAGLFAIAALASDDLRAELRDRLGLDAGAVTVSGELARPEVEVAAETAGRVASASVGVGDRVAEGDVLVTLGGAAGVDPRQVLDAAWDLLTSASSGATPSSETVADLEAALASAREAARAADDALRAGASGAAGGGNGSAGASGDLDLEAELARAVQRIAEARLVWAEGRLSPDDVAALWALVTRAGELVRAGGSAAATAVASPQAVVRAPSAGTVVALLVRAGDPVVAGQPVARLARDGALEVTVRASADDADGIEVGDVLDVDVGGFDDPFEGEVLSVTAVVDGEAPRSEGIAVGAGDGGDEGDDETSEVELRLGVRDPDGDLEAGRRVKVRIER